MKVSEAQKTVDDWIKQYGVKYFSELTNMAMLTEEVGEVARIIARRYGEQSEKESDKNKDLGDELADVLFVLICLANQTGIDLEEALKKNLDKKTNRDSDYPLFSQNTLIGVDEQNQDIGSQENIYKVKANYIIQNNQAKNLYLLRADAKKGITIRAAKKTIKPGDTTIIVVEFIPQQAGKFSENIDLVTSADGIPFKLSLSGNIKSIKTDDKTACFYFKKPNHTSAKTIEPIVVTEPNKPIDTSNKIPDNNSSQEVKEPSPIPAAISILEIKNESKTVLDEKLYKPNNIIFLVDVSSSMRDTNKLKV